MGKKLCDEYTEAKVLCDYLKHDECLYVNHILDEIVGSYDIARIEDHYHCMEANCGLRIFHRLLGFFKLYKDIPAFREKLNDPAFPPSVLSELIITVLCQEKNNGRDTAWIAAEYLDFIKPEKLIQVISETDIVHLEPEFVLHILGRFGNRYIDQLLAKSEEIRKQLTELFLNSSEKVVSSILSANPVIYEYIMLFLELEERNEEAQKFERTYFKIYEDSRKMQSAAESVRADLKNYSGGLSPEDREKRILFIMRQIESMPDRNQGYRLLEYNNAFADDREREMIKRLTDDASISRFIDFSRMREEVRSE